MHVRDANLTVARVDNAFRQGGLGVLFVVFMRLLQDLTSVEDGSLVDDAGMAGRRWFFRFSGTTTSATSASADIIDSVRIGRSVIHHIAKIFQSTQGNARNLLFSKRQSQDFFFQALSKKNLVWLDIVVALRSNTENLSHVLIPKVAIQII